VLLYSAIGVAVSGALFFTIHAFARPPPRTMTKEWQEATNEYLRVCHTTPKSRCETDPSRPRNPTPSMVSAAKVTKAKATFRAHLQSLRVSAWNRRNRRDLGGHGNAWGRSSIALHCTVATIPRSADLLCVNTPAACAAARESEMNSINCASVDNVQLDVNLYVSAL
jgi:hypothetical protein